MASRINRELATFCELLVEADRAQEWLADGSPTPQQWLTARFGLDPAYGRRLVRLARRLDGLPELSKRFGTGEISLDAVELLSEVATPQTELELIEKADGRDLSDVARIASRANPPSNEKSARERDQEWASTQWDLHHRRMAIRGDLYGAHAEMVEQRLVAAAKEMPKNPETRRYDDWTKRMANALVEVCATSEGEIPIPTTVVHTEAGALFDTDELGVSELQSGPVISVEMARMLSCDCDVELVFENDGTPVGIGRKSRKIPGWLRRQVIARDHHCRFPGCGRTAFIQIHHRQPWSEGGATDLDNLVLLCWWHHIFIHEKGWHITRDPGGRFVFRKPDWTPYPPRPT